MSAADRSENPKSEIRNPKFARAKGRGPRARGSEKKSEIRNQKSEISPGSGGLPRLVLDTPAASAHVYLHGAHVTHFQPRGQQPVLWMSAASLFAPDQPIRGGVPICFPWFGGKKDDPAAPSHGFARNRAWELRSTEQLNDDTVRLVLALSYSPPSPGAPGMAGGGSDAQTPSTSNSATAALALATPSSSHPSPNLPPQGERSTAPLWPGAFEITHTITIGPTLTMQLDVTNLADTPMTFEMALHTYFTVADVRNVEVTGLEGVAFIDKIDAMQKKTEHRPVRITQETDRVYLNSPGSCALHDPKLGRRITIDKTGSQSTIIWNPWIEKSKRMPDFGDDEWPGMLCIETANVGDNAVTLGPGDATSMQARVVVKSM